MMQKRWECKDDIRIGLDNNTGNVSHKNKQTTWTDSHTNVNPPSVDIKRSSQVSFKC